MAPSAETNPGNVRQETEKKVRGRVHARTDARGRARKDVRDLVVPARPWESRVQKSRAV